MDFHGGGVIGAEQRYSVGVAEPLEKGEGLRQGHGPGRDGQVGFHEPACLLLQSGQSLLAYGLVTPQGAIEPVGGDGVVHVQPRAWEQPLGGGDQRQGQ
jgi:hypothetical protein